MIEFTVNVEDAVTDWVRASGRLIGEDFVPPHAPLFYVEYVTGAVPRGVSPVRGWLPFTTTSLTQYLAAVATAVGADVRLILMRGLLPDRPPAIDCPAACDGCGTAIPVTLIPLCESCMVKRRDGVCLRRGCFSTLEGAALAEGICGDCA